VLLQIIILKADDFYIWIIIVGKFWSYWTKGSYWLSWSHHFESFTNDHGYVLLVVNTSLSFPHSWLVTGFVTRLTRRVLPLEQGLPTIPEHLSSPPGFSGVRVTRSLVLCVCFVDRYLSFYPFYVGHCVVCPSIYGFWLPLWSGSDLPICMMYR
jgi:hypothetical protein